MWIFSKPPSALTEEDLLSLVANGVREDAGLEFKRQMYARRDPEARREMLRDISSIANAEGGVLIVGIEEDGQGTATALVPIPDAEAEAARIISSCLANITERIPGLLATRVPIRNGDVIIVSIPRSYRRPHMVTADGANELWIRHDRQKSRMSIAEVRGAVTVTEELQVKVQDFVGARLNSIRSRRGVFAIAATPLLLEEGRVAIASPALRHLLEEPPTFRPVVGVSLADRRFVLQPTLRGLAAVAAGHQELEVFRNGHVEFMLLNHDLVSEVREGAPARILVSWMVAEYVRNLTHFLAALRRITDIADPYLLVVAVFNCLGVSMSERGLDMWGRGRVERWQEGDEIVMDTVVAPLDEPPDRSAQHVCDRFWNAFHFERCPFFDAAGAFTIPT